MKTWFTSDQHFGHGNIIKYSSRPFKNSDEMNAKLVQYYNERIKPEDLCIINGDFCFKSGIGCVKYTHWLNQLNGQKIMVKGNHDASGGVKTYIDSLHMTFANNKIHVCHVPEHGDPSADIIIVGHVHNKWKIRTFKEHYTHIVNYMSTAVPSDREDWARFIVVREKDKNSEAVLFNCGVDVNNYRPVNLDEVVGQVTKYKRTGK